MPDHERLTLSDHPLWAEAEADLRAVFEHMTISALARRYTLGRQASDVVYPRALLAAVALELVQELVFARPAIGAVERAAVAEACRPAYERLHAARLTLEEQETT